MNQPDSPHDSPVEAKHRRTTHIRYHYFSWSSSTRPVIAAGAGWSPPMDLYETLDECVIEVNLGGIPPEQVRIQFDGRFVQISGLRPEHRESGVRCYHVIEIERGAFERIVELPTQVDPETAQATFRDGMLVIRVTKREGGSLAGCFPADSMEGLE